MRNSPSRKASFEASEACTIPIHLVIDESRSKANDLIGVLDEYDRRSEEYMDNPSLDKLFKMAETISPVSPSVAVQFCKDILNKYPFHERAQGMIEKFEYR